MTNFLENCTSACCQHLEGLYNDFQEKFKVFLKNDYPAWLIDLQNFEPYNDIDPKIAKELLDMKENVQLTTKIKKKDY